MLLPAARPLTRLPAPAALPGEGTVAAFAHEAFLLDQWDDGSSGKRVDDPGPAEPGDAHDLCEGGVSTEPTLPEGLAACDSFSIGHDPLGHAETIRMVPSASVDAHVTASRRLQHFLRAWLEAWQPERVRSMPASSD